MTEQHVSDAHEVRSENTRVRVLIIAREVRRRLGNISEMSLWRRQKNDPNFPRHKLVNGVRYWFDDQIDDYIEELPEG